MIERRPEEPEASVSGTPKVTRRDAVVLAGLVATGALVGKALQYTAPLARDISSNPAASAALSETSARSDGNPNGRVRLIAFNDFLCPICKVTSPDLARATRADGDVRVEYKDLSFFGPLAEEAARFGVAMSYQEKYPTFHHGVMQQPRQTDRALLRDVIETAGGSWEQAERDLVARDQDISAILRRDSLLAFTLGIGGTPAFLIGGLLAIGRKSEREFRDIFDQARELKSY